MTFEQRRDAAAAIMGETLWLDEEEDQAEATNEVEPVHPAESGGELT